jgi:hypothetical protein
MEAVSNRRDRSVFILNSSCYLECEYLEFVVLATERTQQPVHPNQVLGTY